LVGCSSASAAAIDADKLVLLGAIRVIVAVFVLVVFVIICGTSFNIGLLDCSVDSVGGKESSKILVLDVSITTSWKRAEFTHAKEFFLLLGVDLVVQLLSEEVSSDDQESCRDADGTFVFLSAILLKG
jgi:hypothetical protein